MRAGLTILGCALLSGCGSNGGADANGAAAAAVPNMNVAAQVATTQKTILAAGWSSVFPAPAQALDAFGRVGLRPGAYARHPDGFTSTGIPTPLANVETSQPDVAGFVVKGPGESRIDHVIFTLDLFGDRQADVAKQRFNDEIWQAFKYVGLPGSKEVKPAITAEKRASGKVEGATYSVERTALPGANARRLTVTFSRPGATPPANP